MTISRRWFGMLSLASAAALLAGARPARFAPSGPTRATLRSGVRVVVWPVPGVGRVAIEAVYSAGWLDEPRAQAAHMVEHLVCMGAGPEFAAGESFAQLNRVGMANAETLADVTRYDMLVPAESFDLAARALADRHLAGEKWDEALLAQERPRVASEVDAVANAPMRVVHKFAMMAVGDALRGASPRVRTELEALTPEALRDWKRAWYATSNLSVFVVGEIEPERAIETLEKRLGALERTTPPARRGQAPERAKNVRAAWDVPVGAAAVLAPAPEGDAPDAARDRVALTLIGQVISGAAGMRPIDPNAPLTLGTSAIWPVGPAPFVMVSSVKPGADASAVAASLRAFVIAQRERFAPAAIRFALAQFAQPPAISEPALRARAAEVQRALNLPADRALGMALAQEAINLAVRERLLGEDPARTIGQIEKLSAEDVRALLARDLADDRLTTVTLDAAEKR